MLLHTMAAEDYKLVDEQIGFWGAVALLVGTAIGLSIFVVPTQMAASAGPAITVAIIGSIIPMVLGVLLILQLGGTIPVAGGVYVYASRLIGPYWGLLGITGPVLGVWSYLLFAAIGFTDYLNGILETVASTTIPTVAGVWALLGVFLLLNYIGIQVVMRVQIGLVLLFLAALLTFIIGAAPAIELTNYQPLYPPELYSGGLGPILLAVVLLYIPFQGFAMIIEIGEELENPVKNIPRVLAVGMGIVALVTVGVVFVVAGAVPWQETINPETGQAYAAGLLAVSDGILPTGAVLFIGLGALLAAATTVNTLYTSYSRTVMRAARDEVIPETFAAVHDRFNTPHRAIILLGIAPMLAAPVALVVDETLLSHIDILDWLVVIVVTGTLLGFFLGGIALWNLPKVFPQRYEASLYKLPLPVLKIVAVGNSVVSVVFTLFVAASAPSALLFAAAWFVLVTLLYIYRVRAYDKKGIDLKARMALLHKHEQIDSSSDD
jgi:APA family basic amino acid/polyamine antiporter